MNVKPFVKTWLNHDQSKCLRDIKVGPWDVSQFPIHIVEK